MPPPLSAYKNLPFAFDSGSDSDSRPLAAQSIGSQVAKGERVAAGALVRRGRQQSAVASREKQLTFKSGSIVTKKKKANALLAGIDLENIIPAADDRKGSALKEAPKPSLRARGQTTKPLYDQKYHPMDDVMQPSRAAKYHARHGDNLDYDSESTDIEQVDRLHEQYVNKRRKLSDETTTEGTRRSARHTNRNVIYDTSMHPQDGNIGPAEGDNSEEHADPGTASHHELVVPSGQLFRVEQRQIPDTDDDTSSEWNSTPPQSSPLSSIELDPLPNPRARNRQAIQVWEDDVYFHYLQTARRPTPSDEFDELESNKENIPPQDEDASEADDVEMNDAGAPITDARAEEDVEEQLDPPEFGAEFRFPTTSAGHQDVMDIDQEHFPRPFMTEYEAYNEDDSVLGADSPSPSRSITGVAVERGSVSPSATGGFRRDHSNIELRR